MSKNDKYGILIVLIIIVVAIVGYNGDQWYRVWQYMHSFSEQTWHIDEAHTINYKIPPDWSVETGDLAHVTETMSLIIVPTEQITASSLEEYLDDYIVNLFSSFKNFTIIEPPNSALINENQAATATVRAELFVSGDELITNLIEDKGVPEPVYLEDYELTLVNYDGLMILIIVKYWSGIPEFQPERYALIETVRESVYFGKEPK